MMIIIDRKPKSDSCLNMGAEKVICRVLKEEDFVEAAAFLADEPFPGTRNSWLCHFDHWWRDNPAFCEGWIRGWVLENEHNDIVGFIGNIPQAFKLKSRHVLAGTSTSWCVKKEYRYGSLKLFHAYLLQNTASFILTTTVARELHSIHFRWGYKQIPVHTFNHILFWILNQKNFIKYAFMYKRYSDIISNLAGWLGYLPLGMINHIRGNWSVLTKSDLQIEEVTQCGSAFDELWNGVSQQYSAISIRTADILNWRYRGMKGSTEKYHMLACTEYDSIPGYVVYQVIENPQFKLRRLRIVDLFVEHKRDDVVLALLNAVMEAGRKQEAAVVEITGGVEWICQTLRSTRPFVRKSPNNSLFYFSRDTMTSKMLEDPNAWFATEYDGDLSLF